MRIGMERLLAGAEQIGDRRVGLLSHQAAICADGRLAAEALHSRIGNRLVALLGPEHGYFGQTGAGEETHTSIHPDWKIPVYSLYGETRKPTPEMLEKLDLLILDLQDLSTRCYTYLGTLLLALEACAEADVEVWVADRPVPYPDLLDGPMAQPDAFSFVAPCAFPFLYGMTPAETANGVALETPALRYKPIPMEGWKTKNGRWESDYPPYLPPSPGIQTWETALIYPALVFTEAFPAMDCGRGTNLTFRVIGVPWLSGERLAGLLRQREIPGLGCTPYRYKKGTGERAGELVDGVLLTVTDPTVFRPIEASLHILTVLQETGGVERLWKEEQARETWFDKLYGGTATREQLQSGKTVEEICRGWEQDPARENFEKRREATSLYSR